MQPDNLESGASRHTTMYCTDTGYSVGYRSTAVVRIVVQHAASNRKDFHFAGRVTDLHLKILCLNIDSPFELGIFVLQQAMRSI